MSQIIKAYGGAFVMLGVLCPLCGKEKSMSLLRFIQAVNVNERLCCGDCDVYFEIKVSCLTRDAQLRNEAEAVGQTCPSCLGRGWSMNPYRGKYTCGACDGTGHV